MWEWTVCSTHIRRFCVVFPFHTLNCLHLEPTTRQTTMMTCDVDERLIVQADDGNDEPTKPYTRVEIKQLTLVCAVMPSFTVILLPSLQHNSDMHNNHRYPGWEKSLLQICGCVRDVSRMKMRHKYAKGWKHIKKVKQQRTRYYCHCYRFSIACCFFFFKMKFDALCSAGMAQKRVAVAARLGIQPIQIFA